MGALPDGNVNAEKVGDIIGIDMGLKRTVFLNNYKLVKEAFSTPEFSGRVEMKHYGDPDTGALKGIVMTSKEIWKEQRRFTAGYIQAGLRNSVPIETILLTEAKELTEKLAKTSGKAISTSNVFNLAIVNSFWKILGGVTCFSNEENLLKITLHSEAFLKSSATQGILVFYPIIAKIMPQFSGFNNIIANTKPIYQFAQESIDSHIRSFQYDNERDFVDCYLQKIRNTTDKESSFYGDTGKDNLRHTLAQLFVAGTDTTITTLRWVTFLLAHHQNVQLKLYNSIMHFITTTQQNEIGLKDISMLPYVEAVILEVLRFSSVAPLGLFHETVSDVEFRGYRIPKGTMVVANQYGIHHDPEVWGDPENFRPERFLDKDETEVITSAALIPFSAGRRICPGESLARDELFIFSVNLLLSFKIDFDPLETIPPVAYKYGSTLHPVDHKIVFQKRMSL